MMANIVRTKIFTEESKAFKAFLNNAGFNDFSLIPQKNDLYLNIDFEAHESVFHYRLRGVESAYMASRSNTYYYDLDQGWDDEADEFFKDNDEDDR